MSQGRRAARYSAPNLIRYGLTHQDWPRLWREHDLQNSYDGTGDPPWERVPQCGGQSGNRRSARRPRRGPLLPAAL